ncbi:retrograde regulation protein 2 [Friedmanniomyces endolithicus]|uniref:Retrograde regulation protein 2 n=1 Tax=Friedmanniomyces endolithicus TaxID=329885 RepID=A0AAN6L3Y0_9PEZI|nr:retrograde regulation protein 2 [Friedmanniomyces endolithicus]KAK1011365.1 retrograde regulation protein 2 [Friedmanniomyces endolithicus]KAK1014277.1 retrograde regulation protein 2 [Friedmanniomyces endolithicus]KAK1040836.1 retrograde regulation protein 2 [Friedmanniomyces endolithicus]
MATVYAPQHLRAVVDMGSNGIRFSISSLQAPTARIMPTLYQHREAISLYDAQYSPTGQRQPIDNATISAVCTAFQQFKRTCLDFSMPETGVKVLATEATRTAINSDDFRARIKQAVGWDVTMLAKEEEGRVGAMGVASSLPDVSGLVMDLGGGSTQLSWLINTRQPADVQMPEQGAVSMPYGAAAMSPRVAEAERNGTTAELKKEVLHAVTDAYAGLKVPSSLQDLAKAEGGFTLYLSGGGFRGWGYVLMSRHAVQPYPIPVINGFCCSRAQFLDTASVKDAAVASLEDDGDGIFRVSDRRAGQVPAVAFLVNTLAEALPEIKEVRFCQGGVREGHLFTQLPADIKSQHPLVVATETFDTSNTSGAITKLLLSSLPNRDSTQHTSDHYAETFTQDLLEAFANLLYHHATHSKDLQSSSALRSTTSGILASVHGVLHENRVLLALLLCQRWGGDVPPTDQQFKTAMEQLVDSPWTLWWINYLGAVAALVAAVYPAGTTARNTGRLALSAIWDENGKGEPELRLKVVFAKDAQSSSFAEDVHGVEKVGKKKRWVGGRDGVGYKVQVESADHE